MEEPCAESLAPGNPSTSILKSVTSYKSKCSVPEEVLAQWMESRRHDLKAKKHFDLSTFAGCKKALFCVECCACSAVAHSNCQSRGSRSLPPGSSSHLQASIIRPRQHCRLLSGRKAVRPAPPLFSASEKLKGAHRPSTCHTRGTTSCHWEPK